MNAVDFILDGLEAALEVERELGVRTIEVDRTLLQPSEHPVRQPVATPTPLPVSLSARPSGEQAPRRPAQPSANVVFVHDKPLSAAAVTMMAKIVEALGQTAESAPIIVEPPIPNAKVYVFLGFPALRRYMPTLKIAENCWGKSPKGKDILVVKSPEEIVRFSTVTPAVKKLKEGMWRSLKAVKQRLVV